MISNVNQPGLIESGLIEPSSLIEPRLSCVGLLIPDLTQYCLVELELCLIKLDLIEPGLIEPRLIFHWDKWYNDA